MVGQTRFSAKPDCHWHRLRLCGLVLSYSLSFWILLTLLYLRKVLSKSERWLNALSTCSSLHGKLGQCSRAVHTTSASKLEQIVLPISSSLSTFTSLLVTNLSFLTKFSCWWWCWKILFASGGRKHFLQPPEFVCFSNKLKYFSLVKRIDCRASYIFPNKSVHKSTDNSLKLWNYNPISFQAKTKQNKTNKKYYTVGKSSLTQKASKQGFFSTSKGFTVEFNFNVYWNSFLIVLRCQWFMCTAFITSYNYNGKMVCWSTSTYLQWNVVDYPSQSTDDSAPHLCQDPCFTEKQRTSPKLQSELHGNI